MHQRTMTLAPHESTNMPYAHARCAPPGVVGSAAAGPVEVLPGSCAQVCPGQREEETSGSLVALCPPGLQCRPVQMCPMRCAQEAWGSVGWLWVGMQTRAHTHSMGLTLGLVPCRSPACKPNQPGPYAACALCAPLRPCDLLACFARLSAEPATPLWPHYSGHSTCVPYNVLQQCVDLGETCTRASARRGDSPALQWPGEATRCSADQCRLQTLHLCPQTRAQEASGSGYAGGRSCGMQTRTHTPSMGLTPGSAPCQSPPCKPNQPSPYAACASCVPHLLAYPANC